MLAKLVKQGKIPSLKDRIPPDPVVVQPTDRIGRYGGEWHLITESSGYGTGSTQYQLCGYENLVRWDPSFKKIIPNVADSWKISKDSKEYVFKLHPGIRWSDGEPFTADDVVFAVEDVDMNAKLSPVPPFGEMKAEKLDRHVVKLTFAEANGLFLTTLATRNGLSLTGNPAHYMKKFHKKYNPDADQLAKKARLDDWVALFQQKGGDYSFGSNPGKPTLYGWLLKDNSKTRVVVERNPYYWKVDPKGSQLPYIDRMVWQVVSDDQSALLKVANGEVDFSYQEPVNKPVLARSRGRGKYRFFDAVPGHTSDICVYLNLAHKDSKMRELFQNKDFRIGLSYAIDRREMIDAVFQHQGQPWQIAPRKESTYYDREMARQYLEHDQKKAEKHLDRVCPDKDGRGLRIGPDGKPITFQIDVNSEAAGWVDAVELVVGYWKKVGIHVRTKSLSASLAVERGKANQHDAAVWAGEGGLDAVILVNPYNYLPVTPPYCFFGVPWSDWYQSGGKKGQEPPAYVRKQLQLYDRVKATADTDEQHRLMTQILGISKEEFPGIGTEAPTSSYGTVSRRTQNFPTYLSHGTVWVYMDPAPTNTCQYFLEEE